uniref:DNA-directed RNA polymerase III subunit n=1 Tax=Panagrellus redivivus TaxID=6233 RepID=A0A7E4VVB8_PANRE
MSKAKREAKNGVRAIAGALGIQRHELGAFTRIKNNEPPPLFPQITRALFPSKDSAVDLLEYRCQLQTELALHFNALETNTYVIKTDPITHRYSDDFVHCERRSFVPPVCDLPKSLYPPADRKRAAAKEKEAENAKKAKKMEQLFTKLEAKERRSKNGEVVEANEEANEDDEEEEAILAPSDEEADEDNDYISAYFDNGETYAENPSDDNLEDGDVF